MSDYKKEAAHSSAWVAQTWISFAASISASALGIAYLPVGGYEKGFLAMGLLFVVGSSLSLAKTIRDQHESSKVISQINQAKIQKILAEHDPAEV